MQKLSDQEFIDAWYRAKGSPRNVATLTGMAERDIYRRRDRLGVKGIDLKTVALTPGAQARGEATRHWSHDREIPIEIEDGSVVVFSDAHFWPGEKTVANVALLNVIKRLKPVSVIANGDVFDGAKISRHDPLGWGEQPTVQDELTACRDRMHEIALAAKPSRCKLFWTLGNHDARFDRYIINNASEFGGVTQRLSDHFNAWKFAWSIRINQSVIVKHRWHNGIHATYNNTLKGGLTIVTGHLHRLQITSWGDYTGRRWGVDTGTLSDPKGPQFEYLENNPTPWGSGFAVLTFKDGALLPPELVEVIGDKAFFRGEVVS